MDKPTPWGRATAGRHSEPSSSRRTLRAALKFKMKLTTLGEDNPKETKRTVQLMLRKRLNKLTPLGEDEPERHDECQCSPTYAATKVSKGYGVR